MFIIMRPPLCNMRARILTQVNNGVFLTMFRVRKQKIIWKNSQNTPVNFIIN